MLARKMGTCTIELLEPRTLCSADAAPVRSHPMPVATHAPALPSHNLERHNRISDIFGPDNRRHVTNTEAYPFSAVGQIVVTWPDGSSSSASGALIDSYHFLTAAHILYNSSRGGWIEDATITMGQDGAFAPYKEVSWSYLRIDGRYKRFEKTNNHTSWDMGLVTLDTRVGDDSGSFGYAAYDTSFFKNRGLRTLGYPGDLLDGDHMYSQAGRSLFADNQNIYTNLDAAAGQSGSPVYIRKTDGPYIVGVLVASNRYYTYVNRLTSDRFDALGKWIKEDNQKRPAAAPPGPFYTSVAAPATLLASTSSPRLFADSTRITLDASDPSVLA